MKHIKKFINFIKEVRAEAFKITWPNREMVIRSSLLIMVFCAVMAFFFFAIDGILSKIVEFIF